MENYETVLISMFVFRCLIFGIAPNIEKRTSNIEKGVSSLLRQGESPLGFSYWCNEAKAEIYYLGFSVYFFANRYPTPLSKISGSSSTSKTLGDKSIINFCSVCGKIIHKLTLKMLRHC